MKKFFTVSFFMIISLFLGCQSQNVREDVSQEVSKSEGIKFNGVEKGVTTKWVDELPGEEKLAVLRGSIAAVGNDPFVGYAIHTKDFGLIRLSGDKNFIEFLKNNQLEYLEVAGEYIKDGDVKYFRVLYAKKPTRRK